MKKSIKFLCLSIINSSFLYAASITSFTSDKTNYIKGNEVNLTYSIDDTNKYKLRFKAYDKNGNELSPDFSAVKFGELTYIIPSDYNQDKLKLTLTLIEDDNNIIDNKSLILNVNQSRLIASRYKLGGGDDSYFSLSLPFSFHGYTTIYPNENGYITFSSGSSKYNGYVKAFNPMIWTSSSDLMTNIYVTKWSDKVKIEWEGGYFPNWHGSFSSWVILHKDGTIEQSSGDNYGF